MTGTTTIPSPHSLPFTHHHTLFPLPITTLPSSLYPSPHSLPFTHHHTPFPLPITTLPSLYPSPHSPPFTHHPDFPQPGVPSVPSRSPSARRHAHQPASHHGQAGAGPVRAVQAGGGARRPSGRDQQEAVAGDHQGPQAALLHHQRRLHPQDTVSQHFILLGLHLTRLGFLHSPSFQILSLCMCVLDQAIVCFFFFFLFSSLFLPFLLFWKFSSS